MVDAPYHLVFARNDANDKTLVQEFIDDIAAKRNVTTDSLEEYKQMMLKLEGTKQQDTYAGTGTLEMFEQAEKTKNLIEHGMGTFISPKPNRLVLINKNVVHGITRVDKDAGENVRLTLTGFFNFFKTQVVDV